MSKSLYLINPLADFPSYFSAEVFRAWGFAPATSMADLAIATVAALAPSDFEVRLCDENVSPVDFDVAADFIGITLECFALFVDDLYSACEIARNHMVDRVAQLLETY